MVPGLPETMVGMAAYTVSKNFGGEKIPETIALAGYIKNKICEPTKKEQQLLPQYLLKRTNFVLIIIFLF